MYYSNGAGNILRRTVLIFACSTVSGNEAM